jgi:hypothetical protein
MAECFFLKFFVEKDTSCVNLKLLTVNIVCGEFTGFMSLNLSLVILLYIFYNVLLRVARFVSFRMSFRLHVLIPMTVTELKFLDL